MPLADSPKQWFETVIDRGQYGSYCQKKVVVAGLHENDKAVTLKREASAVLRDVERFIGPSGVSSSQQSSDETRGWTSLADRKFKAGCTKCECTDRGKGSPIKGWRPFRAKIILLRCMTLEAFCVAAS